MERISEKESLFITKIFPKLWLAACFLCVVIAGFHWAIVLFFVTGCYFFLFLYKKCVEVHVGAQSIHIKTERHSFDVPIDNILAPVEQTQLLRGAYRIDFIEPTDFGSFVVFLPRRKFIFWQHREFKRFLERINNKNRDDKRLKPNGFQI